MLQFTCPACRRILRVADRKSVAKAFACPDCRTELNLLEEGDSLRAVVAKVDSQQVQRLTHPVVSRQLTPRRIAAGIAICLLGALAAYMFSAGDGAPEHAAGMQQQQQQDPLPAPASAVAPEQFAEMPTLPNRLAELGQTLNNYRLTNFGWPRPHGVDQGQTASEFSWIATLVAAPGQEPVWHKSWQDPVNEPFVRRRLDSFLNPLIPQQVGEDRYPATHFVGVAGVGADAPGLPVNHPRAGIFGTQRVARSEDVKDGLSNTLLVAGVQSQLGSWAVHGPGTIRPFTAEPYLNGPDGFGTGEPEKMFVLMADGSVREISADTAPVIVRRLAAMADGFAITPEAEGDPLTAPLPPELAQTQPNEMPVQAPLQVPVEPQLPLFPHLEKSLSQKLLQFQQTQAISLRIMLTQLEELIGAPIEVSAATEEQLEQTLTLDLQETTVGDVLTAVLKEAGLAYRADPMKGILLRRSDSDQ